MKLGATPRRDLVLLAVAVVLMLGGAVMLVGGWLAGSVAIPLVAVGVALVVVAQDDMRRQHAKQVART